jgi:hypothetical protein
MIYGYIGELGAGKTYYSTQKIREIKSDGESVLVVAWADPLKEVIADIFGLKKSGPIPYVNYELEVEDVRRMLYKAFSDILFEQGALTEREELKREGRFDLAWDRHAPELMMAVTNCWAAQGPQPVTAALYSGWYRSLIQLVGTEFGRAYHTDLWVNEVIRRIKFAINNGICRAAVIDDIRFPNELYAIESSGMHYEITGIKCNVETRAERLGKTIAELDEWSLHDSEKYIPDMMQGLENIIDNSVHCDDDRPE